MRSPRIPTRWWAAGAAVLGVAAVTVPIVMVLTTDRAQGGDDSPCPVEVLPGPDGSDTTGRAVAVSDDGEYVAGEADDTAALWHNGEYLEIGAEYTVTDVNSRGEVTVQTDEGAGLWRDGEFTALTASGAETAIDLTAINDDGEVIGNTDHKEMDEPTLPLRWEPGETEAEELEVDELDYGVATGISAEGDVVGYQYSTGELDDERVSWMWSADGDSAALREDATHGLAISGPYVVLASSIDDAVTSWDYRAEGEPRPVDFDRLAVEGVTDDGTVYGSAEHGEHYVATAQGDAGAVRLPTPEGIGDSAVTDSNADGTVLAGRGEGDDDLPFAWRCESGARIAG